MTFLGNGSHHFLNPVIGNWDILVKLLAFVIAANVVFKLAFWRSIFIALIFYAGVLAEAFALGLVLLARRT